MGNGSRFLTPVIGHRWVVEVEGNDAVQELGEGELGELILQREKKRVIRIRITITITP